MIDSLKISPEIHLTEVYESTSDPIETEPRNSKSNRNHNPVRRHFDLAAAGKATRKSAIHAMCAHCMGCTAKEQGYGPDHIEPGFREQIRNCSSGGCTLMQYRPYQ